MFQFYTSCGQQTWLTQPFRPCCTCNAETRARVMSSSSIGDLSIWPGYHTRSLRFTSVCIKRKIFPESSCQGFFPENWCQTKFTSHASLTSPKWSNAYTGSSWVSSALTICFLGVPLGAPSDPMGPGDGKPSIKASMSSANPSSAHLRASSIGDLSIWPGYHARSLRFTSLCIKRKIFPESSCQGFFLKNWCQTKSSLRASLTWSNQCTHDFCKHIRIPEPFCRGSILSRPQRQLPCSQFHFVGFLPSSRLHSSFRQDLGISCLFPSAIL